MSASVSECASQVGHHRKVCLSEQLKIATKKMKKFVCGEACAPEFAGVGVQRKMGDGHRVFGSQVAKFVVTASSPPARGGGRHQGKFAKEMFDEENLDTQADFCWQQNRVLTYWHEQQFCDCYVSVEFLRLRRLLNV